MKTEILTDLQDVNISTSEILYAEHLLDNESWLEKQPEYSMGDVIAQDGERGAASNG